MSKRMTTWQKATALVPLALLSGAWTASLAVTSASAEGTAEPRLPDGSVVPSEPVDEPANISPDGDVAPGVPKGAEDDIIESASVNGIPASALRAYQRAAQVIDAADPKCKVEWPLIAAIGRVESNHGRYGGNVLDSDGVARPGIWGIALDGTNGTAKIMDTDAGQYDRDKVYDRAVGPMQFIPSTWAVVGVDGDGDGERNPQDIDDAALATAVYLCSGDEDLSTRAGQESAVFRYNRSNDYVRLVLSIMEAYASGDYSSVPNNSTEQTTFTPFFGDSVFTPGTKGYQPPKQQPQQQGGSQSSGGSGQPSGEPSQPPATQPSSPTSPGSNIGGGEVTKQVEEKVENTVKDVEETVKNTLTPLEKATQWCKANLTSAELTALGGLSACTSAYLDGGAAAVTNLLDGLLGTVDGLLGG